MRCFSVNLQNFYYLYKNNDVNNKFMIDAFIISIAANLATAAGTVALSQIIDSSVYRKIEFAFSKAVKKWSINEGIIRSELIWSRKRLEELTSLMSDPSKLATTSKGNIELLELFKKELQKDDTTWRYLEGELFKNLMSSLLDTKSVIEAIHQDLERQKINPIELKNQLIKQSVFQVEKNISSGKYIPATFLEVNNLKDHIRYFSDPSIFHQKIFSKAESLNFDYLRRRLHELNKGKFEFTMNDFDSINIVDFNTLYSNATKLHKYLALKSEELDSDGNLKWAFSYKVKRITEDAEFIYKKLCILTADAGQGKTNFICDFVNNVLVKREIPSLYVNGYELDASDVANSLAKAIYPSGSYSFQEILKTVKEYCSYTMKPFVIIIDGLNENMDSKLFCTNLCTLLKELLNCDFVKVLLTCRTEYYKEQFSSIGQIFSDQCIKIDHIHSHLEKKQKDRLVNNYLAHFNIRAHITEDIIKEFSNNILLLRIFSEAYKGENMHNIRDLRKAELFENYYNKMCDDISSRMSNNGYLSTNNHFISEFIQNIISHMIQIEKYNNIDIRKVIGRVSQEQLSLYNRFLDENIILRRDLITSSGAFGRSEVINFTYDEFRDYLIASYLINITYNDSKDLFENFIKVNTESKSIIAEGIRSFLFLISKKSKNVELDNFLASLDWYDDIFLRYVWEIKDEFISNDDVLRVKRLLPEFNKKVIPCLIFRGRWDTNKFKILNINIVLEYLASLDDDGLNDKFYTIWYRGGDYGINYKYLNNFLDELKKLNKNKDFFKNIDAHNVFKVLIYITPFYSKAKDIYILYQEKHNNKQQMLDVKRQCNSTSVIRVINNIL